MSPVHTPHGLNYSFIRLDSAVPEGTIENCAKGLCLHGLCFQDLLRLIIMKVCFICVKTSL